MRHPFSFCLFFRLFTIVLAVTCLTGKPSSETNKPEFWMGVYVNGQKVGYVNSSEAWVEKEGRRVTITTTHSWMKVSRLGGFPVEIETYQEVMTEEDRPLEILMRSKMSANEVVIRAEVLPDKIVFRSKDKLLRELPYNEEFYLGVPIQKIIREDGFVPEKKYTFRILDPLSFSFQDCRFEIQGRESVRILGRAMDLWKVRTEMISIIPLIVEEWMDEGGNVWKMVTHMSFLQSTAIRMPKERALDISTGSVDMAFSSVVKPDRPIENPRRVKSLTLRLSGVPLETIESFPFDEPTQSLIRMEKNTALIKTAASVQNPENAVSLSDVPPDFLEYLEPSLFCQSDDPEINKTARDIVGDEKNTWKAALKIAQWIHENIDSTYDVGFATAKEILRDKKGDCSEHTVLTVALCRAAGIPARAAVGALYANGFFAYHMWPEVYTGRWTSVDPLWMSRDTGKNEFHMDAARIKFGQSALDEKVFSEMVQAIADVIGRLKISVIEYKH